MNQATDKTIVDTIALALAAAHGVSTPTSDQRQFAERFLIAQRAMLEAQRQNVGYEIILDKAEK